MQRHCEPGPLCAGRPPAADTLYSRHKPLLLFKGFRAFRVPALAGKPLTYGLRLSSSGACKGTHPTHHKASNYCIPVVPRQPAVPIFGRVLPCRIAGVKLRHPRTRGYLLTGWMTRHCAASQREKFSL